MKLSPPEELQQRLRTDYASMQEMLFDEPPKFDDLLNQLAALETKINSINN